LIKENAKAGEIIFTEVYSTIQNVSNLNKNPIIFKNTAKLMGEAPISLEWIFYTEANHNLFKVYGIIKNFNASEINSFMSSNLRATSSGTIEELYFTISGDANASTGDIKMKYEDFKFQVLTKDRSGVNEILTAVGNIFTNDGSNADKNGYRYGSIQTERDDPSLFLIMCGKMSAMAWCQPSRGMAKKKSNSINKKCEYVAKFSLLSVLLNKN
jgi:uncharacterized protein YycO